ncbi:MAG: EthD family reductase [Alphaproteobacteria bacterium]|nr:EthD family reductase [Alphaproteobacteria bacterium]
MIKRISILTRKPEFTPEAFRKHWLEIHGPLARKVPGIRRYVQNHITEAVRHPDLPPSTQQVDGIVEMLFDDREAMETALTSPEAKAMFDDGTLFIETVTSFVVDPKVVIAD